MYVICLERCHYHLSARSFNSSALCLPLFWLFYPVLLILDCFSVWILPFDWRAFAPSIHLTSSCLSLLLLPPPSLVSVGPIAFVRLPLCFILHPYLCICCTLWIFLLSMKLFLIIAILADCYPSVLKCSVSILQHQPTSVFPFQKNRTKKH